jgi:crotonobetaine/carnitine-CoA ligase
VARDGRVIPTNPIESLIGSEATVPALFAARVRATPNAPFLLCEDDVFSYRESFTRSAQVAAYLRAQWDEPQGHRVASFIGNRPESMWAWLGTLLAGATYVPLNRQHRGALLVDMLTRARAEALVTDADGIADLPELAVPEIRSILVADSELAGPIPGANVVGWSEIDDFEVPDLPNIGPSSIAEVMYTSGTTGRSKAVQITHNQLCRGAGWVAWSVELGPQDVMHGWMPLYHIAAQLDVTLATMVAGGSVALFPTFSRSRFWSQVERSRATVFVGFSNILELIWRLPPRNDDRACSLRAGIAGGIPPELHRPFEDRFGLRLVESYGMTEAEPIVMPAPGDRFPVGTMGRATPDFEIAVVDDHDRPLPAGETGEIVCRGRVPDVVTPGYEGDADATLVATRNLWFHTGDIGRIDEQGYVTFVDRRKHAIRRRGENISSWELENLIAEHPDIQECCAVAVPSPLGDDDVKIIVVPGNGRSIDPDEVHAWCDGRMARFMVPRYIEVRDVLPRNSVGKVAKTGLAAIGDHVWDADLAAAARAT